MQNRFMKYKNYYLAFLSYEETARQTYAANLSMRKSFISGVVTLTMTPSRKKHWLAAFE